MARLTRLLLLLLLAGLSITITEADGAAATSPLPSILTPYAAASPSESPSSDIFNDSDAASIGAPVSYFPAQENYYPEYPVTYADPASKSTASFVAVRFAATASVVGAVGFFLL